MKALFLLSLLFLSAGLSGAADAPREIKHRSRDLEKIRDEMSRKREERERLKRQAGELSNKVKRDQARMKDVEKSLLNTRRRHVEVEQKVAAAKIRHDGLVSKLGEERLSLNNSAHRYYVAMLLQGQNGLATVYGKQAVRARGHTLSSIKAEASREHENLDELVSASTVLRSETQKQQSKLTDIRTIRRDNEKLLDKTMTRQELIDAELKQLQQSAEELASLIDNLRTKARDDAAEEKRRRQAKQQMGQSPILARSLPWPVKGKVSTKFGRQQHPTLATPFISNGIVIDSAQRGPIEAVADGKVLYAGEFMGYGAMAVVEHPGDWFSVYARLARWDVEKGQELKRGETVGTSRSRPGGGAETYFELRFYGKPTDPLPWLVQP